MRLLVLGGIPLLLVSSKVFGSDTEMVPTLRNRLMFRHSIFSWRFYNGIRCQNGCHWILDSHVIGQGGMESGDM